MKITDIHEDSGPTVFLLGVVALPTFGEWCYCRIEFSGTFSVLGYWVDQTYGSFLEIVALTQVWWMMPLSYCFQVQSQCEATGWIRRRLLGQGWRAEKSSAVRNGTEQTESGCPGLVVNENYNSYSMCESSIQKLSHSTWVGISCTVIRFSFSHL